MLSACGTRGREEADFEVKCFERTDQVIEEENGRKNDFASIEEYLKAGNARIFSFGELEALQEECGAVLFGELPEMEGSIYGYVGPEKEYQGIWIQDKEGQFHAF